MRCDCDDADGDVDCDDDECTTDANCTETGAECTGGTDEDADGYVETGKGVGSLFICFSFSLGGLLGAAWTRVRAWRLFVSAMRRGRTAFRAPLRSGALRLWLGCPRG